MNISIDKTDWKKVKLDDVVYWHQRNIPNDKQESEGIENYVVANHIDSDCVSFKRYDLIRDGQKGPTVTKHFEKGDFLISTRSVALRKAALAPVSGVTGEKLIVLRVKEDSELIPELLPFVCHSNSFWEYAQNSASGSVNKFTSWTKLREYEFLLPPKEQQAKLAELVWSMDAVIEKDKNLYESINIAKSSFFENYLRQGFENGIFKKTTLGDIADPSKHSCVGGPFGSDLSGKHYVEEPGVPVIRGANLSSGEVRFIDKGFVYVSMEKAEKLSRNMAFRGDIVVTQRGTLGQVGIIPENSKFERYVVSQSQMKLQVNIEKVIPEYVYYYLLSSHSLRELEIATICTGIPHINLSIFKKMKILLPNLQSQKEIVKNIQNFEATLKNQRTKMMSSKSLQNSLINQVF
ncbi:MULTISPECIES: restriction endonuclease subunit S [Vibrio]|uniref:restriction endonuclease subunit S n=1 Tax=Vibrio TaxID=662 RepID=UPI0002DBB286|nr:restriction endonuclease subunit S [Vibrio tasmaniensis]OEF83420.1 hypothetical protein A162_11985 [Vibrio tasmaniensis 1F-155]